MDESEAHTRDFLKRKTCVDLQTMPQEALALNDLSLFLNVPAGEKWRQICMQTNWARTSWGEAREKFKLRLNFCTHKGEINKIEIYHIISINL